MLDTGRIKVFIGDLMTTMTAAPTISAAALYGYFRYGR
jgi:hypothetical protein